MIREIHFSHRSMFFIHTRKFYYSPIALYNNRFLSNMDATSTNNVLHHAKYCRYNIRYIMQYIMLLFPVDCSLSDVSQYSDLGHGFVSALLNLISRDHDITHPDISSRWISVHNINALHVYMYGKCFVSCSNSDLERYPLIKGILQWLSTRQQLLHC